MPEAHAGDASFSDVVPLGHGPTIEPWEPNLFYPVVGMPRAVVEGDQPDHLQPASANATTASSTVAAATWLGFRFYKETFSRVDGNTCRFAPSCSRFALEAVRDEGLLGLVFAFGRLHHNHQDEDFYRRKGIYLHDPVTNWSFSSAEPKIDDFARHDDPAHAWYQHVRATRRLIHPIPPSR